jgi:hypothetical protein
MSTPPRKKIEAFTDTLYGVFGRFQTTESHEVNYFLSSLHVHDLELLTIAKAALDFSSIRFEDMMQRDVDYERVDDKIIEQYLEKGKGRVLFFPPIIVSVVAFEGDKVIDLYDSVDYELPVGVDKPGDVTDDSELSIVFDKDKFCIQLSLASADTGYKYKIGKHFFNYHSAWATLKYNKRKIKLIVIDGQHRFEALRRLVERKSSLIEAVELPICVVFTPKAKKSDSSSENIVRDLREMFVTINTTAKQVSGHFLDLLNDKSLSSIAVRSLANRWKSTDDEPWRCLLQQLEWNERQSSRANTLQRNYSISTVSIIAEALRLHAFSSEPGGLQYSLLSLSKVEEKLENSEDAIKAYYIEESTFTPAQSEILQEQIETLITPALHMLFTQARPYKERREGFLKALLWLDSRINAGSDPALNFRAVLGDFRRCTKKDPASTRSIQAEFDSQLSDIGTDDDSVYFYNLFQQALIGVWVDLSYCLRKHQGLDITPEDTAGIVVDALNYFAFKTKNRFFDREMPYVSSLLYTGARLNVTQANKIAWKNLLKTTLLGKGVYRVFEKALIHRSPNAAEGVIQSAMSLVMSDAQKSLIDYCETLKKRISTVVPKEWAQRPYERGLKDKLERLQQSSHDEYVRELNSLIEAEYQEAIEKLSVKLSFDLDEIKTF